MADWMDFDSDGGGQITAEMSGEEETGLVAKRPRLDPKTPECEDETVSKVGGVDDGDVVNTHTLEIIDELVDEDTYNEEEEDEGSEVSDFDMDDEEIHALLEDGVEKKRSGQTRCDSSGAPIEKNKIVLKERGHDPFEILPEGWVTVTHNSGMPVYLHKESRVCTMSKPYFLGPGSARKHDIPLSAIPCLHYKRELLKENEIQNDVEEMTVQDGVADSTIVTNGIAPPLPDDNSQPPLPPLNDSPNPPPPPTESPPKPPPLPAGESPKPQTSADNIPTDSKESSVQNAGTNVSNVKVKIESAEERKKLASVCPMELRKYCQNRFEFKVITVQKFKTWKDRRKHHSQLKKQHRPALPGNTRLITCPLPAEKGDDKKKEFVLNPSGKSYVCILHEYVQHALRVQPKYIFRELENARTPYSASVVIGDVEYGTGYASSKRSAKMDAAKETLAILIPEMVKVSKDELINKGFEDLSFFDEIKIEDPRIYELCGKAGQPSPYQVLQECLRRNYGMGDTHCKMNMNQLKHQKNEFFMSVGKHEAKVNCRNKREGKQYAAQAILQLLHPYIHTWGSLLRLYGRGSCNAIREKKQEEQSVTNLQVNAKSNRPNTAVLDKLKEEMTKLQEQKKAIKSKGTFLVNTQELPANVTSINL